MHFPTVNYLAVLVAAILIFALGGLWYSPVLFARRWIALQNRTEEEMKAQAASANMPMMYLAAFICAFIQAWVLAALIGHLREVSRMDALHGAVFGAVVWLGFAGSTSYATALFSGKPKQLWVIDSGYNLVSFVLAALILTVWI